jgi:hypothetical protein
VRESPERPAGLRRNTHVRAAIQFIGSDKATLEELERRLRCSQCGNRQIGVTVQPDTRTAEAIERNGPAPETRAGLPD